MRNTNQARADFINSVLTSSFPDEVVKRFSFADGEVGALYTLGRDPASGAACPVILYVATFPPSSQHGGHHDFGIDYVEYPVNTPEEAKALLAQFSLAEATLFRLGCRTR